MTPEKNPLLTLFTWGYCGWGNAVPELLDATERVELLRGFEAPIFVDVRFRRAVRAIGFREKAFEKVLGPDRYRWMKSLGNASIGDRFTDKARIAEPEAVNELIDLAQSAAKENRRIIFFCSCETLFSQCHRHEVARLTINAARHRGIALTIMAWPGGEPQTEPMTTIPIKQSTMNSILSDDYNGGTIPISKKLAHDAVGWPWGASVIADDGSERAILGVGPALLRAGKWSLPVGVWGVENAKSFPKMISMWRKEENLDALTSAIS